MNIPQAITLVGAAYCLDGGSMALIAVNAIGEKLSIQLNQHRIASSPDPGRLLFNEDLIDVRSAEESKIIQLLKNATVSCSPPEELPNSENQISKDALILGDDIKNFLATSPENNIRSFRDQIIAFVESEEYVQIAKNGLSPQK